MPCQQLINILNVCYLLKASPKAVGKRTCFHPGASSLAPNTVPVSKADKVGGWQIVRSMLNYVWPKDKPGIRARVVVAVGLLIGSKVH